ncbi:hypothetical protein ASG51_21105 [Methylobacterium sp. Leaf465]|uniref:hypothetical protein n=1 Tax=Methylobacterium sp. Leaf465 TaxID=1736385 RepID=UPI0006F4DCEA|nr:hypothetical protein [Methylobacterium sp. Leaf465]KQT80898.1 hypothetical protein ASG51_21105 [Methylobacterium sp. Leaf465]
MTKPRRPTRVPARPQESRISVMAEARNDKEGSYRMLIVKAEGGAAVDAALGLIKAALGKG